MASRTLPGFSPTWMAMPSPALLLVPSHLLAYLSLELVDSTVYLISPPGYLSRGYRKLNMSKTKLLIFTPKPAHLDLSLSQETSPYFQWLRPKTSCLSWLLSFIHTSQPVISKSCQLYPQNRCKIWPFLSALLPPASSKPPSSVTRLDYCTSLPTGILVSALNSLQAILSNPKMQVRYPISLQKLPMSSHCTQNKSQSCY